MKFAFSFFCAQLFLATSFAQTMPTERAIDHAVVVKARVAEAYKTFTTREGIVSFFAPDANVDARVDGPFELYINPYAPYGQKGGEGVRFLALQENKMISFTWNAPPTLPEVRKQRTVVVVRFTETSENETQVRLHHVGWGDGEEWDKAFTYFSRAWPNVLANFQKRFVTGPIDWAPWLDRMKQLTPGTTTDKPATGNAATK